MAPDLHTYEENTLFKAYAVFKEGSCKEPYTATMECECGDELVETVVEQTGLYPWISVVIFTKEDDKVETYDGVYINKNVRC